VKQVFEKYLGKEDLLEVYTRDSENFDVGRVLGLDDDFVLLHAMSKYGRDEGLVLVLLADVVGVQAETIYLKKTRCLSERYPEKRQLPVVEGDSMLKFLLDYAQKSGLGVSFELKDGNPEDYCGLVLERGEDVVTLKQVKLYGEYDGIAYVRMDEIGRVDCDDQQMSGRIFFAQENC